MTSNLPKASSSPLASDVVLKTRTAKVKTTRQTLLECNCDVFDSFLGDRWKPDLDKKGRRKLRLDFDDEVFRRTLVYMQRAPAGTSPPEWEHSHRGFWQRLVGRNAGHFSLAQIYEQRAQLQFLCHRPTLEAEQAAAAKAAVVIEAAKRIPAGFVRIAAGDFMVGSPEHEAGRYDNESHSRVELTRAFWYQSTPVTQGQWQSLMLSNPSHFHADGPNGELASERPVERVNWYEAAAYCNALSVKEGLSPYYELIGSVGTPGTAAWGDPSRVSTPASGANGYRLPSEAEQQRARRGSDALTATNATYVPTGRNLGNIAWYRENAEDRTRPVGLLLPTNEGVYDALGNVWEWSNDWYAEQPAVPGASGKLTDPIGSRAGTRRTYGGGGYCDHAPYVRTAFRSGAAPSARNHAVGFRPARFVPLGFGLGDP